MTRSWHRNGIVGNVRENVREGVCSGVIFSRRNLSGKCPENPGDAMQNYIYDTLVNTQTDSF